MKKTLLLILAGIIGVEFTALANVEQANKLTAFQKQQIVWALKILGDTKTLTVSDKQCVELDQDILSVLESGGHLERGGVQPNTICIGPSQEK